MMGVDMSGVSMTLPLEIVSRIGAFLSLPAIYSNLQVSKVWSTAILKNIDLYKKYENERIPRVAGDDRNSNEDFLFLYPRTISTRQTVPLGEPTGELSKISKEDFDKFRNENDPFQPELTIEKTFCIIVEPLSLKCVPDSIRAFYLETRGDKYEGTGKMITVSYSITNAFILALHPLKQKNKTEIVLREKDLKVLEACELPVAKKAKLHFMRRDVPQQTLGLSYAEQAKLMEKHNMEMATLSSRFLFDVLNILNRGTCPDTGIDAPRYVRTPQTYPNDDDPTNPLRIVIGGYTPKDGLVIYAGNEPLGLVGAVPSFKTHEPTT